MAALTETGRLRIGDADLDYRMIGPPPGRAPTLILLHEGLGCVAMWRDFPDRLADATGLGVFVYSRQGYGASSPCRLPRPLDYMHIEGERVLPELLAAIGFSDGFLIGHSDGASIAAIYAGGHRDRRPRGLVLMAPHFFTEAMGLAAIAAAAVAFDQGDLRARLIKYHGNNVDCAFWGWNRAWLDPGFRNWDLTPYLPRIEQPILVIQGSDDRYGTGAQIDAVARLCPGPVRVELLSGCGHSPPREQPDRTLAAIADWIRTLNLHRSHL